MKRFDFTKPGGFPLTQETLAFMQESYSDLSAALVEFFGDNAIVSGCNVNVSNNGIGGNISNGWIIFNNELIPFVGGSFTGNISGIYPGDVHFKIQQNNEQLSFANGTQQTVKFSKIAVLTTETGLGTAPFVHLIKKSVVAEDEIIVPNNSLTVSVPISSYFAKLPRVTQRLNITSKLVWRYGNAFGDDYIYTNNVNSNPKTLLKMR